MHSRKPLKKFDALISAEISDVRAEKENYFCSFGGRLFECLKHAKIIAVLFLDDQIGKFCLKMFTEKTQRLRRNVDGHIGEIRRLLKKMIYQQCGLAAVARAEFYQIERSVFVFKSVIDLRRLPLKYLTLTARQIIFRQLHYLLKDAAAFVVVKIFRGERFRRTFQAASHIFRKTLQFGFS